jgi:hypothetical protein
MTISTETSKTEVRANNSIPFGRGSNLIQPLTQGQGGACLPQPSCIQPAAYHFQEHPHPPPPSTQVISKSKPPSKPYNEYTMFYLLEHAFIFHHELASNHNTSAMAKSSKEPALFLFINDPFMPARYRSLPLCADWYISGTRRRKKHRKTLGSLQLDLNRTIGARWAVVDDETRKYCRMMAEMECVVYKENMCSYKMEQISKAGEVYMKDHNAYCQEYSQPPPPPPPTTTTTTTSAQYPVVSLPQPSCIQPAACHWQEHPHPLPPSTSTTIESNSTDEVRTLRILLI